MANPDMKSENYVQLGGINVLVSPYKTGPTEFLNLVNFDFQTPGSLTKRWGSTAYFGQTLNAKINNIFEFEALNGLSQVIVCGQTYFKATGTSLTALDIGPDSFGWSFFIAGNNVDTKTFVNQMFSVNGQCWFRYTGETFYFAQLPCTSSNNLSPTNIGVTATNTTGWTGVFFYGMCYINNRGALGPSPYSLGFSGNAVSGFLEWDVSGRTSIIIGITCSHGPSYLSLFGISHVGIFRSAQSFPANGPKPINYLQLQDLEYLMIGTCTIGGTFIDNAARPLGITAIPLSTNFYYRSTELLRPSLMPKYMEIYNNQLFVSGDATTPSTVYYSDLGEPESFQPEAFFEVRTNDGSGVSALKNFNGALYIFKPESFAVLTGDNPDSFALKEVSDEYGCVSSKAVVVYDNFMVFLDKNGVVRFNGANIEVISHQIDPIIRQMNIPASLGQACMVHDKSRNQILIAIPYRESTVNNLVLVYDYLVNAWTKYEGLFPSALAVIKGRLSEKAVAFGGYTGLVSNFGASFSADNGVGFTALFKSRFIKPLGESVTKQFRRLYINVDPVTSSTSTLNIEFFSDYSNIAGDTRTMYQDPFQSVVNFGIPAKSLAIQVSNFSSTDTIRLHGYTIDFRFQRAT